MAEYTRELVTDITLPNIEVYQKLEDGKPYAYYICAKDGYVIYDTSAKDVTTDEDTGEEILVRYYTKDIDCPLSVNFDEFTWVAVRATTTK